MVVEAGKLHIYPDVYSFKKNTVENLRLELKNNEVDTSEVSDETLKQILAKAKAKKQYVVSLEQLRAGDYLSGEVIPVLNLPKKKRKRKSRRRRR